MLSLIKKFVFVVVMTGLIALITTQGALYIVGGLDLMGWACFGLATLLTLISAYSISTEF